MCDSVNVLKKAHQEYLKASDNLTVAHAEVRALTANKNKTIEDVNRVYDKVEKIQKEFNRAKYALEAAERAQKA